MKKCVMNAVLLLIASSHLVASAQDATKPGTAKAVEKPAAQAAPKADDKKVETKPEANKADDKKADKKADEKKPTNRLPSNYGKLGLTDAQKAKVYGVQDKHEKEIDGLAEKLKAARAKRDAEIEAILTPEQKKMLKEITSAKDEEKSDSKGKN